MQVAGSSPPSTVGSWNSIRLPSGRTVRVLSEVASWERYEITAPPGLTSEWAPAPCGSAARGQQEDGERGPSHGRNTYSQPAPPSLVCAIVPSLSAM